MPLYRAEVEVKDKCFVGFWADTESEAWTTAEQLAQSGVVKSSYPEADLTVVSVKLAPTPPVKESRRPSYLKLIDELADNEES